MDLNQEEVIFNLSTIEIKLGLSIDDSGSFRRSKLCEGYCQSGLEIKSRAQINMGSWISLGEINGGKLSWESRVRNIFKSFSSRIRTLET
jgi:hypothetical protein